MTEMEFWDFARSAARCVISPIGKIGHLVLTQTRNISEPITREPEMRAAFQLECEQRGQFYGIEVPTKCKYRFTTKEGDDRRSALVDFAFLDSETASAKRDVLVEFKGGQPTKRVLPSGEVDYPTITKDIRKLWAEPVTSGRCMFHIMNAADLATIQELERKYNIATKRGIDLATETKALHPEIPRDDFYKDWSLLIIFVLRQRESVVDPCFYVGRWDGRKWLLDDKKGIV